MTGDTKMFLDNSILSGLTGDPVIDASLSFCDYDHDYRYDHGDFERPGAAFLDYSTSTNDNHNETNVSSYSKRSTLSNPLFGALDADFEKKWGTSSGSSSDDDDDDDDDGDTNFDSSTDHDTTSIADHRKPVKTQARAKANNTNNSKEKLRRVRSENGTKKEDPESKVSNDKDACLRTKTNACLEPNTHVYL
jgi:hypothetical protein